MTDPDPSPDAIPGDRLSAMNAALAEWAACSAAESPSLIERFEAMGYRVRGKSREEVAEVLKHPPAGPAAPPADGR